MTLADKLKNARAVLHISQRELAEASGLSLRTIQNYELGARMPKRRDTYARLSAALGIDEQVLLDDKADFVLRANERYGNHGAKQAWDLVADFRGLCSDGGMNEDDMDSVMKALQDAYWDAKKINRRYGDKPSPDDAPEDGE